MPNFISKIVEALESKSPKFEVGPTERRMNRQLRAPTDIGELSGYFRQTHSRQAIADALLRMKMKPTRANRELANTALSMQAQARTRAAKNPSLGFDTSIEEAFRNAARRAEFLKTGKPQKP